MSDTPVCVTIELDTIRQIKQLLADAACNSQELLSLHDQSLGRATKKNKIIAKMYEKEIAENQNMVALLSAYTGERA